MESKKKPEVSVPGGFTPVDPDNNLKIEELARFAVDEYNKKQKASLQFEGVLRAEQQVVAGMNYLIDLEAKHGDVKNAYQAKVFVSLTDTKELEDFQPLHRDPPSAATA